MNYKLALLFGVLVWMGIAQLYATDTPPTMNGNDTSPTYYTETNTSVIAFPDFTISDVENDDIKGLVIAFTSGYSENEDILSFTNQNGITGTFDKTRGALILSGAASPANYQTAVRSITYSNDAATGSVSDGQRTLTISLANADYFSQDGGLGNGHFYQFVGAATGFYTSSTNASAKTYYGLQGYLATITSAEENTFIKNKIPSNIGAVWLGGSDATTEGSWLWTGGTENGTKFYDKGTNVSTGYTNWYPGEPNDANGGEDCLLMYRADRTAGTWGDGANTTGLSYIVEYGGTPGDPTLNMTTTTTLNVVAPQPPVMDGHDTSPTYFANGTATPLTLFPDFTISGAEIRGLVIAFTSGNHTDQDVLSFTDQNGITGTFDKTKGALILSGLASPEDYQAAVRSITYSNDAATVSVSEDQRELTIALANSDYLKSTGHFYEYVNAAVTWSEAAAAASAKTYYGLQGYLATVTSAEENSFILNKISDMIWLGGSDRETEGTWKWVTGPESGNQFSTGANAYNGSYVNWNSGEPNSSTTVEDYLMMYASTNPGEWNDINLERTYGYVVEYGGMTGDPSLNMTTTTTLNVLLPPKNLSYADAPVSGVYGTAITAISPTVTGTVDSYSVSPSLPAGLILDKTTGKISGTPTEVSAQTDYTVTATNDAGSTTTTIQITVDKRTLTVTATAENKIYDGTTTATVTFSDDRVSGDVLTVANTSAVFDDKNVGSGKTVTVSGISISGTAAGNYTLASATAGTTADITAKTLTVSAAADNKEYDGTTTATVTLSDDRVSGDVLTVANTSAVFDDKNVGSGKTVTVSGISISGTDAGNYTLASATAGTTADITAKTLTVSAAADNKEYDGTTTATVTLGDDRVSGDVLTVANTSAVFDDKNVGSGKTVTVSGISISGTDAGNYALTSTTAIATADITKAALNVTANDQSKTYGEANPTLTVSYSGFVGSDSESDLTTAPTATTTATTTSGAGTYTITPAGGVSGNYTFSYKDGTMTVNKAALSVTANDQSKTYGEVNPTLTVSYSGFVGSDGASDLTTAPTATTTATTTSGAGTYPITASGGADNNYTFSYTDGTLTVGKAALSVTADDQSKTYGEANPTLTVSYSGFVGSDGASDLTTAPTATTTATTTSGAGTYTITVSGGADNNYTFSYTDGTLTVDKAVLSVTADDQSKTYGEANPTLTVSYSGFVGSDGESDLTTAPTATTTATTTSGAGTYPITASGGADDNYTFSYTYGTLTVNKAALSVTADDQSKTYGEINPTLTVSYSGFVGSDGESDLTTAPTSTTTATTTSGAGTYPITASGGADNNYTFSYTDGTLTVNKAALSVTADDQSKTYGEANPTLTVSYSGFVGSDGESDLTTAPTATTTATTTSGAGTYTITVSGGADNNYTFSYTDGTLTVGKAALSVTADDQSKTYGEANPTLTVSYSGFVGSDGESDLTTAPTATTTATTTSGAGTYTITVSGGADNNYTFSYTDGTLTVDKTALSVTANDQSKTYGEANPTLTVSYSGFVGSDGASDLSTAPTASTTATTASGAGTYTITVSGGVDNNYTFSYTDGTLTVGKAALSVTANDQSKTYGEANPTLTVSYSGFVGSESESDLTTAPTASTTATTTSGAGTYTITPSGGADNNYTFSYTDGTLTVDKAALSVTADDQSKTYGEANPTLTVSYSGFVGSDSESDLTTAPTATTTATTTSGAGTYTITPAGGVSGNYTFSYTDGTMTVNKAALSVTADDQSKTYGEANPTLTVSYSGFVGSDSESDLTTAPTATTTATTTSGAGTYTITPSGGADNNYTFSYTDGTLTVDKAVVSVTADDQSKTYGEANPTLTISYSGFVGSDGASDLTTAPTATTTATTTSGAGTYTITVSGGVDNNYTFSYTDGTLTVGKAALSVTADDQSKTYGEVNPTLTVSYSGFVGSDSESDLTTAPTATTTATTASGAGTYTITPAGGVSDNYTFSYTDGTLTVNKAALSVTADDQSKTYGEANPTLTISYSGFVGSDCESDLTTAPTASTTATTTSGAGTYTITPSGGADNNYTFSYTDGTLTVDKAVLSVTADDQSKTYGEANPTLTISYSGFVGSDSESDLTTAPTATTTATTTSGAGTYTITPSGGADNNYTFSYTDGTLTVNKAALSVTADDQSKTYGEANPTLTISYSGFVGSDSESDLTTAPTATTTATTTSGAGTYPITASGGADNNYTFSYTDGTLTVGKKTQAITFNALENRTDKDVDFELNAISSSGLSVIFTSSNESVAICTGTNGSTIKIVGVGDCIIYADQPGNSDYDAAPRVGQPLTVVKYIAGDTNHDGIIDNGEVAGDTNGDGTIGSGEVAGDTNGDGTIDNGEVAGDTNGDGTIGSGEVAGDTNGDGTIGSGEVAGDTNGDGTIGSGEVAGDTDGNGSIDNGEVAGDTNGDGTIGSGEVAGDTDGNGSIDNGEVAGDTNGDGTIGSGEVAGDTNGDGTIDSGEVAGDTNGDGTIDSGEVVGDTNGDGTIDNGEVAGDTNGDGTADNGGIAGDTNGNGSIDNGEVAGDTDGNGSIDNGEVAGDTDGDGTIDNGEVAGDTNGDGTIDNGEVAGDTNGDGQVTPPEIAGDTNGDGTIDNGEVAGDTNGDGQVTPPEIAGDTNGDGTIDNGEVAGDTNGDGQITPPEITGDTNGDGSIGNGEVAGDTNGDGTIDNGETQVINPKTDHANIKYLFSPNGDGINDYWKIPNILDLGRVHVKVYDRWGNLIYESTDYQNNWDGTYKGKPVPEGAYIYFIITQKNGTQSGVVNLVR